jgi:cytochrome c5
MSTTHHKLPKLFWVQLLLVAIVAVLYIYYSATDKNHGEATDETNPNTHAASKALKPVGNVALTSNKANTSDKKARSGEQVFNAACSACHTAGIANAPKPDDKAAWEPRVAQGLETLVKTAISGKGAMPPRGGNPAITDEELKNAIIYMTTKAGFDLASAAGNKNTEPDTQSTASENNSKTEAKPVNVAQHAKPATPPVQAAAPTTAEPPRPLAAPTPPTPPTPPEDVVEKAVAVATSPASTKTSADPGSTTTLKKGEKIYKKTCFACHATGVAGAPKLEDKANWAPRIASGKEALYHSALNGKGVMPPKGGNMGLADKAVKAAVDYMVNQAQ